MSTSVSRELVQAFYRVYTVHDAAKVAEFLADDVTWIISGPIDVLPYCGVRHGKAAVIELVQRDLPALFIPISFEPGAMLIDGERVATLFRLTARRRDDGRVISYRLAHFLRFRDGKIIENVSIIDSFNAVEQVIGHSLDVHEDHAGHHNGAPAEVDDVVAI